MEKTFKHGDVLTIINTTNKSQDRDDIFVGARIVFDKYHDDSCTHIFGWPEGRNKSRLLSYAAWRFDTTKYEMPEMTMI